MSQPQARQQAADNKGKRIVRTTSRAVDNIVLLTLLVILMLACYAFWDTHKLYSAADVSTFEEYKPSKGDTLSFEQLRAMNPDVIGWLTIYDTTIDYPVLRSPKSNNDYLSKNALGEWEGSGSLFIDHNNKADFSDFNTIIFGHHMAGPSMFGEIDSFLNKSFFDKHEYANLFFSDTGLQLVQETPSKGIIIEGLHSEFVTYNGRNHGVQFFAMIQADGHDSNIYNVPAVTTEGRIETLKTIANKAILVRNIASGETRQLGKASASAPVKTDSVNYTFFGLSEKDRIVLLSTCSADLTNGRYVLCGKLLDYEVPNPFPEENKESNFSIDIFSFLDRFAGLSILEWILILIGLIVMTSFLYYAEKKRLSKKFNHKPKNNILINDEK